MLGSNLNRGQMLVPAIALLFLISSVSLLTFLRMRTLEKRLHVQVAADVLALSGSRVVARTLNGLVLANKGIDRATIVAKRIVGVWAGLAACAAACTVIGDCGCKEALRQYSPYARRTLNRLKKYADALASAQDKLVAQSGIATLLALNKVAVVHDSIRVWIHQGDRNIPVPLSLAFAKPPKLFVERRGSQGFASIERCRVHPETKKKICKTVVGLMGLGWSFPGLYHLQEPFDIKQSLTLWVQSKYVATTPQLMTLKTGLFSSNQVNAVATAKPASRVGEDVHLEHTSWDARLVATKIRRTPWQIIR